MKAAYRRVLTLSHVTGRTDIVPASKVKGRMTQKHLEKATLAAFELFAVTCFL